ncbi:uncharacterized protein BKA78DRAFT_327708 [Phyllosticta capitalensis]|uniref:uncharacterized protein n=1 Tax=Phyllosticta capitalensis TaxID=121624 RepID=UPI00312ECCD7
MRDQSQLQSAVLLTFLMQFGGGCVRHTTTRKAAPRTTSSTWHAHCSRLEEGQSVAERFFSAIMFENGGRPNPPQRRRCMVRPHSAESVTLSSARASCGGT